MAGYVFFQLSVVAELIFSFVSECCKFSVSQECILNSVLKIQNRSVCRARVQLGRGIHLKCK